MEGRKCDFCICDHKRYINCGCPCTKHLRDKCPNPDKAKVAAFKKRKAEEANIPVIVFVEDMAASEAGLRGHIHF